MSKLLLAGNLIDEPWNTLTGFNYGHLQVVFENGEKQSEIEVSGISGPDHLGSWEYSPVQAHTVDAPEKYAAAEIDLGERSADSVWKILKDVHEQFSSQGSSIRYGFLDQNSNSYAATLLKTIGLDDPTIVALSIKATPEAVDFFPGFGTNVLENTEVAIPLNLTGKEGNDIIHSGAKEDKLDGGGGNDKLFGYSGDDILSGGWGFDLLDGGEDIDTADYSFYKDSDGLKVDLGAGDVGFRPEHSHGSPPALEQLVSIENVIGGGGDDTLIGSSGDNVLTGGAGHDQFTPLAGSDIITDFNVNEDSLFLTSGSQIRGSFLNGRDTVLAHAGGTVTLSDVNLGPEAANYPWLEWSDIPWGTLGGQHQEVSADASSEHLLV